MDTNLYKEIKGLLVNNFREMERNQIGSILFFGAEEVAELAYLYMQVTNVELVGIIDDRYGRDDFLGFKVDDFAWLDQPDWDVVLVTRLDDIERDIRCLIEKGVSPDKISTLSDM